MLKNYVRVTVRNLKRHIGYSTINILGLATGLAVFVLISMFVQNELSYDEHLENGADLYRVNLSGDVMGQTILTTNTPIPLASTVLTEVPEVVNATRIDPFSRVVVEHANQKFYETDFFLADSTLFEVFGLNLALGDPTTALVRPNTIVVTQETAQKYFGSAPPLGKILRVDGEHDYEVTGVLEPSSGKSHFVPSMIGSFVTSDRANSTVWLNNSWNTYLLLTPGMNPADVEAKFPDIVARNVGPEIERMTGQSFGEAMEAGLRYEFILENVPDIYLHSKGLNQIGPIGNIQYVYIMSVVGLFVLLIACINFMNLSTARATNRAREVGLRKVMGSDRRRLIYQFMGESFTMAGFSMILAVAMILLVIPVFNSIAGTSLTASLSTFTVLLVVSAITGLVAGAYPAFVLSGFRPVTVLKGNFSSTGHGSRLRSSLVVFQFAISMALLVGTGVVLKQLDFIQSRDVGFDQEQVVVLPLELTDAPERFESFRDAMMQHAGILEVAGTDGLPGPNRINSENAFLGESESTDDIFLAHQVEATHEYVTTLGMKIIQGRNFSREYAADGANFIINEEAARELELKPEEAVGTQLIQLGGGEGNSNRVGEIVGVVANAHFNSMHEAISPLVIGLRPEWDFSAVRFSRDQTESVLAILEDGWTAVEPNSPFSFYFLDEDYARYYDQERRLGTIYGYFAGLAIFIACLGLFGLASFVTTQRTKEIGVRKVLGASVPSVVRLLSKQFTLLVLLSCVFAFPVAYFAMNAWLQNFAYATTIGWEIFVIATVLSIAIAWLTVGYQSIRAALSDPVKALRYE